MYDFHHHYVKHRYGKKAKLLFADADSLCYETESIYRELWEDRNLFGNSDYPKESQFFDLTNMKVIGKFKAKAAGMRIVEFIGLK